MWLNSGWYWWNWDYSRLTIYLYCLYCKVLLHIHRLYCVQTWKSKRLRTLRACLCWTKIRSQFISYFLHTSTLNHRYQKFLAQSVFSTVFSVFTSFLAPFFTTFLSLLKNILQSVNSARLPDSVNSTRLSRLSYLPRLAHLLDWWSHHGDEDEEKSLCMEEKYGWKMKTSSLNIGLTANK